MFIAILTFLTKCANRQFLGLRITSRLCPAGDFGLSAGRSMSRACSLPVLILLSFTSTAGEILDLSVTQEHGDYKLRIGALLDAPENCVYQIITDYAHAYRINPSITSIEVSPSDDNNVVRVQHYSKHRVGLLSFEVAWAGDIEEPSHGSIHITTVPDLSSFDSGYAVWKIQTLGDRTYVRHESSMKPKFFIPPIIGSYFLKKHMKEETLAIFNRIERLAQTMREREAEGESGKFGLVSDGKHNRNTQLGYKEP